MLLILAGVYLYTHLLFDRLRKFNKIYGRKVLNLVSFLLMSRYRTKCCFKCSEMKELLYRCRYDEIKYWVFLCGKCLKKIKLLFEDTYQ